MAPLVSGVATFTTTALPLGDNSITASFQGDAIELPSLSGAIDAVVTAPVVVVTTDTGTSTSQVVVSNGGSSSTALTLSSLGALGAPITFTVTGMPANTTCSFDKNTVDVTNGPEVVNATFTTTPRLIIIGQGQGLAPAAGLSALFCCGILALPFSRRRKGYGIFLSALALVLVSGLACSSKNGTKGVTTGSVGTPAGTYAVTITAAAQGATPVTATINLTVN